MLLATSVIPALGTNGTKNRNVTYDPRYENFLRLDSIFYLNNNRTESLLGLVPSVEIFLKARFSVELCRLMSSSRLSTKTRPRFFLEEEHQNGADVQIMTQDNFSSVIRQEQDVSG